MMEYSKKASEYGQLIWGEIDNEKTNDFKKALNNYLYDDRDKSIESGFLSQYGSIIFGENKSTSLFEFRKSFKQYFSMD